MKNKIWYWVDTGWGCGGVLCEGGTVIDSAPIFRKFIGQSIYYLATHYKIIRIK